MMPKDYSPRWLKGSNNDQQIIKKLTICVKENNRDKGLIEDIEDLV